MNNAKPFISVSCIIFIGLVILKATGTNIPLWVVFIPFLWPFYIAISILLFFIIAKYVDLYKNDKGDDPN
jgi:uncharacterized protein (DUF983 family)